MSNEANRTGSSGNGFSRVQTVALALAAGAAGAVIGWVARGPGRPPGPDRSPAATTNDPRPAAPAAPTTDAAGGAAKPGPGGDAVPRGRPPAVEADGVTPMGDGVRESEIRPGAWIVRAGDVTLYVTAAADGGPDPSPAYVIPQLSAEQAEVLVMRRRILNDKALREHLKMTPEQLAKLREFGAFRGVDYGPEDRKRLVALFKAWRKARPAGAAAAAQPSPAETAAETALVAALAEVGTKATALPRSGYDPELVERAYGILSAEQVKAYQEGAVGGTTVPAPAAR